MKPDREHKPWAPQEPDLLDPAPRDPFYIWLVGVAGAVALAVYGWGCIRTRSATYIGGTDLDLALGSRPAMHLRGASAIAFGIMWIGVACFLHVHFFWSWREKWLGYAQLGKLLSLIVAVGGLGYFAFRELFTFW